MVEKDITKCFGLLKGSKNIDKMKKEIEKSRKAKWRVIKFASNRKQKAF